VVRLDGANPMLRHGYLVGAFVTSAIYYFPSIAAGDPVAVVDGFNEFVIDVTQAANGDIVFATAGAAGTAIHRLHVPLRGDCNGDGLTNSQDVLPLMREIDDGAPPRHPTIEAQGGTYPGSWGCDANADGLIDASDLDALSSLLHGRRRAVR
jgi:hypothetical protein